MLSIIASECSAVGSSLQAPLSGQLSTACGVGVDLWKAEVVRNLSASDAGLVRAAWDNNISLLEYLDDDCPKVKFSEHAHKLLGPGTGCRHVCYRRSKISHCPGDRQSSTCYHIGTMLGINACMLAVSGHALDPAISRWLSTQVPKATSGRRRCVHGERPLKPELAPRLAVLAGWTNGFTRSHAGGPAPVCSLTPPLVLGLLSCDPSTVYSLFDLWGYIRSATCPRRCSPFGWATVAGGFSSSNNGSLHAAVPRSSGNIENSVGAHFHRARVS